MFCPDCASPKNVVVNSRTRGSKTTIYRRRECLSCGLRWNTREIIVKDIKKGVSETDAVKVLNDIQNLLLTQLVEQED